MKIIYILKITKMADLLRVSAFEKQGELVESTRIGGHDREIEEDDVVEIIYPEGSERYLIWMIEVVRNADENDFSDVTIYLKSYLIEYNRRDPIIKHIIETDTWQIQGQPDIPLIFHPRSVIPTSKKATKYLRRKAGKEIWTRSFDGGGTLNPDSLPYSNGQEYDIDSMIKSVTKYWELLLFDPWIQEMIDEVKDDVGADRIRERHVEIIDFFGQIYEYLNTGEDPDGETMINDIERYREKYLALLSPDVKPARDGQ